MGSFFAQDVGIISTITKIDRIELIQYMCCSVYEDINTWSGAVAQRGLGMTFSVNRYCTLYIWVGTLVKQRAAYRFLLFQ